MNLGLRKSQIETIVRRKLEKEPDLKYYVDNDYVMRLVDLLWGHHKHLRRAFHLALL